MSKDRLITSVHQRIGLPRRKTHRIVKAYFEVVTEMLAQGQPVHSFGNGFLIPIYKINDATQDQPQTTEQESTKELVDVRLTFPKLGEY